MPKTGMEPIRREALVTATIAEIGRAGTLDVTVSQIARRAGVSSALAHHYFGGKDQIFAAAMRHLLTSFGTEVRDSMAAASGPRARLEAIIRASFSAMNFRPAVIGAWLNFYVQAQTSEDARRLLRIYQRRLQSNLIHELKQLAPTRAREVAEGTAALIDGLYIRQALSGGRPDGEAAVRLVLRYVDSALVN